MLTGDDFGEKTQRFALENQQTAPFLSSYANAVPPSGRWRPVSTDVVSKLASLSAKRVETNERFGELRENILKAEARDGKVRLSDMIKEQEEAKVEEASKNAEQENGDEENIADASEDAGESREISPQLEEATNILVDLIFFQS